MTYSVYQHWDPLKVCVVGISYPPDLYDYIKDTKIRSIFYKIAEETEEDYQKLISLLESFNVKVLRPDIGEIVEREKHKGLMGEMVAAPGSLMQPRDSTIMLGEKFYLRETTDPVWKPIVSDIVANGSISVDMHSLGIDYYINGAMTTRIGKDLYIGTSPEDQEILKSKESKIQQKLPDYRVRVVDTAGHIDGCFCPVKPGLIVSTKYVTNYEHTFPGWDVVYLKYESWSKIAPFVYLKQRNGGKWWVPGQELNNEFTYFIETWMNHWVGFVEESVFDVNMLVIDKNNVVVNGYNKIAFDAFAKHGVTPHVCNFRHRYFWDGGLHCITSDISREGVMEDYFPERG